jgi:alkylmercury lyase
MSIDASHLATRLTATLSSGHGTPGPGWLWPTLLRQLATGRPVTLNDLAQHSGRSSAEVRDKLAALSDTEYDEQGRVIGHGITLRPTPHHFTVEGHQLYTWCALDTLIFPTILGRPARVSRRHRAAGTSCAWTSIPPPVSPAANPRPPC